MTARIYPVDAVSGAPSYTGRYLRQTAVSPFVAMGSAARPLGAKSGVRVGTPSSTVAATSTTWTVTLFAGVIDGESAAIAGPYGYSFDANVTGSVTAAGGSARVDRLDVQVSDPAESDGSSTPGVAVVYTVGTPGLASAPARSHALAQINVPVSGGGSPTVTWVPSWAGDPGEWTFNTLAELTAYTSAITSANVPVLQQATVLADVTTTNNGLYQWTGSAWYLLVGDTGWLSITLTVGTTYSSPDAAARLKNGVVYLRGTVTKTSNYGTGDTIGTVPTVCRPASGTMRFPVFFGSGAVNLMNVNTAGSLGLVGTPSPTSQTLIFGGAYPID